MGKFLVTLIYKTKYEVLVEAESKEVAIINAESDDGQEVDSTYYDSWAREVE